MSFPKLGNGSEGKGRVGGRGGDDRLTLDKRSVRCQGLPGRAGLQGLDDQI